MKKKYGNMLVLFYLAFLSLLTIEITFHKIHETSAEIQTDTMEIVMNDYGEDSVKRYEKEIVQTVSTGRTVVEETVTRDLVYDLSQKDYETLLKIVEAEAGCEDGNGKLLVANVVLNRVKSSKFPSTVYEVVYQADGGKVQFTPAYNGRLQSVRVSEDTKKAVERALYGEDISDGALYFVATDVAGVEKSSWFYNHLTHVCDYGGHSFFK